MQETVKQGIISIFVSMLFFTSLFFTTNTNAATTFAYLPYQVTQYGRLNELTDNVFDRHNHYAIGMYIWVKNLWRYQYDPETGEIMIDPVTGYPVRVVTANIGEQWDWTFTEDSTGQVLETSVFTLVEINKASDLIETCFKQTWGSSSRTSFNCTTYSHYGAAANGSTMQCIAEGNHSIKVNHNGGNYITYSYTPTKFGPGTPQVTVHRDQPLYPKIDKIWKENGIILGENKSDGTIIDLEIKVEDDVERIDALRADGNCKKPMPGVDVKVVSTVEIGSGGHKHFDTEEKGTGHFVSATPKENKLQIEEEVSITSKTDNFGKLWVKYQAGKYGIKEKLVFTPEGASEDIKPYEDSIITSVQGLVPLSHNSAFYTLFGSYTIQTKTNDQTHNNSKTDRMTHYLTSYTKSKVEKLAEKFNTVVQRKLSLNDASFQYGGFFDWGDPENRDRKNHTYHRAGQDIDINTAGLIYRDGENKLRHHTSMFQGIKQKNKLILGSLAEKLGAHIYPEETIHYRFYPEDNQ